VPSSPPLFDSLLVLVVVLVLVLGFHPQMARISQTSGQAHEGSRQAGREGLTTEGAEFEERFTEEFLREPPLTSAASVVMFFTANSAKLANFRRGGIGAVPNLGNQNADFSRPWKG
jgi:hypothetical protein